MTLRHYSFIIKILSPLLMAFIWFRAFKGKEDKARISERFGRGYRIDRPAGKLVWLHAVSVGEAVAARQIADRLKHITPDCHILITTNTITAAELISAQTDYLHVYQPADNQKWVEKFLNYWKPDIAIFMESDFWPHLISSTAQQQIPVIFASAQLSQKAYSDWLKRPALAAEIFSTPTHIFCVDEIQEERFKTLSQAHNTTHTLPEISVLGSLKLAPENLHINAELVEHIKIAARGRMVIAACSTHEPEEMLVVSACAQLLDQDKVLLIIAPRHPSRADELADTLSQPPRRSITPYPSPKDNVFLCDSLGEMDSLYAAADLIILGGSFIDTGGHNMLEPARALTPILTGPYDEKNKSDTLVLCDAGIAETISDSAELQQAVRRYQKRFERSEDLLSKQSARATRQHLELSYARAKKIAHMISETLL